MCQINQCEGTKSFVPIKCVLRELFAKNHGGSVRPPPTSARVNAATNQITSSTIPECQVPYWAEGEFSYISVHVGIFFFYFYRFAHDSLFPVCLTCLSFSLHGMHPPATSLFVPSRCRLLYAPVFYVPSMFFKSGVLWSTRFSDNLI